MSSTDPNAPVPTDGAHRTKLIEHAGRPIVSMNYSHLTSRLEFLETIEASCRFVAAQPRVQNLLTLIDVTGTSYDPEIVNALTKAAVHNKPWVLAAAVVGLTPLRRLVYRLVIVFSGRKIGSFKTVDAAKAWLVSQKIPPVSVPQECDECEQ